MSLRFAGFLPALLFASLTVAQTAPSVLVFSKTTGFRHTSIPAGVEAVRLLGEEYGWTSHWTENGDDFTDEKLAPYAAVVFMSTTMDVLDSAQQAAFERYIRAGNGYVGVHAAADTEYDWAWYRGLVGRQFVAHPDHQRATLHVEPNEFGGMTGFGDSLTLFEEWYEYTAENADSLHYLLTVDEDSYNATPTYKNTPGMGDFHPIAWWHEYDGGRAFYTGIGHMDATYALPAFRAHLAAGIAYAISGEIAP